MGHVSKRDGNGEVRLSVVSQPEGPRHHHPVTDAEFVARFIKHTLRHTPNGLNELQAAKELLELLKSPIYAGKGIELGRGEPVMLIPGMMCTDMSLAIMGGWLNRIGYRAYPSGIFNVFPATDLLPHLERRIDEIGNKTGSKVTLIGDSFGGALAKLLSDRRSSDVSKVIGITPVFNSSVGINPLLFIGLLPMGASSVAKHGRDIVKKEIDLFHELDLPVKVPHVSIYSKSDGILTWKTCLRKDADSYEVKSSHLGAAANKHTYYLLADLLHDAPSSRPRILKLAA